MTDSAEKNHTVFVWKNHKINEIAKENIRVIDQRPHVTLRWISARFRITYTLLQRVLAEIEEQTPIYADDQDFWIDDAAWVEICNHPLLVNTFDEAVRLAVLQLLGHYRRMNACHQRQGSADAGAGDQRRGSRWFGRPAVRVAGVGR